MSNQAPPPLPPLPRTPANEAARAAAPASAATGPYVDPDDTGVPTLKGDVDDLGRGFFAALFDLSFKTFITRRLASIFYLAGLVVIAIGFLVPLFTFIAVVVLRFVIESVVALIAVAENTQQTAKNTDRETS